MFNFVGVLLSGALCAGVAFGAGYYKGGQARENKIMASLAQQQKTLNDNAQQARDERQDTENKVVTNFVNEQKAVQQAQTIVTKEIPVYVTKKSNDACTVPLGFISVYDQATIYANGQFEKNTAPGSNQFTPPKAGDVVQLPKWAEQRSNMSLTDIAQVHDQNMKAFATLRGMYEAMREWANTSCYAP